MNRRLHRPEATVAFGRLDRLRPGYGAAVAAAEEHGFAPLLREPGGHAVAYHPGSLVIETTGAGGLGQIRDRFAGEADRIASALRTLGVDARVGPVPGEYCPGEWSVNRDGTVKLAGLAQRVRGGRFTLGASLICEDAEPVRAVLVAVYAALELDFDPATVGVPGPAIAEIEAVLA